jgi:hypothetical protein
MQLGLGAFAFAVGVLFKIRCCLWFYYDCFNRISIILILGKRKHKTITTSLNQEMVTVH